MIFKAIEFAAKAHAGQFRKQSLIPYIFHPLAVGQILLENGCSEEVAVAGVLHDTVEDTSTTLEQIDLEFGENVARLVQAATEPQKSHSWEERKQHTLAIIKTASKDALTLICADKLHNIISIKEDLARQGESVWARFSRPKHKQQWYFESVCTGLNDRLTDETGAALVQQLRSEVALVFGEHGE